MFRGAKIELRGLEEKYRETHLEWANAQANCAIFEAQLKKRMENEHLLASQVSTLASRLAECSHELNEGRVISTKRIKELEDDQLSLNETVEDLTARLQNISAVMQNTHKQQMIIVDDAIGNEEIMADCMETHAKMVSESIQQERHLRLAREEMMQLLEQSFGEADEKRHQLMNSITDQGKHFSNMIKTRGSMLSCVQTVTTNVASVLQNDLAGLELRQECDETKIDEAEEEMLTEGEQQQQEIHVESVEEEAEQIKVTDSPKKFALLAEVVAVVEAEEEERTEFDEKRSVLDDRITAE